MTARVLFQGHCPDGQPVEVWQQTNAWNEELESFLTFGRSTYPLDHITDELVAELANCLTTRPTAVRRAA